MADNLELVCLNAASDSWVDSIPGAVSTGYQNQNIAAQATWLGYDKSSVYISGSNLIIPVGGIIDVSGLPFVVKTQITLALPSSGTTHFLKVVDGSGGIYKDVAFTTDRGTFSAIKNAWYNTNGDRILDWIYFYPRNKVYRLSSYLMTSEIAVGSFLEIRGGTQQNITASSAWTKYVNWNAVTNDVLGEWSSNRFTAKQAGKYRIICRMAFPITGGPGANATGQAVSIYKNGAEYQTTCLQNGSATYVLYEEISFEQTLSVGNYIEVYIKNSSASGTYGYTGLHLSIVSMDATGIEMTS